MFAGRDASVALAKMSFNESDLNDTDISKLKSDYLDALNGWTQNFKEKYPIVGTIVDEADTKKDQ